MLFIQFNNHPKVLEKLVVNKFTTFRTVQLGHRYYTETCTVINCDLMWLS
jgi:hypothetical protein